ncbi:hypothetical protein, partial [Novosphingobium sp. CCH12-A3]|uniref:hypothetical protein n=1 Tax=Novosphingobium sp. CCH12-A3 TaxID=1768752 RepID=UPI000B0DD14C
TMQPGDHTPNYTSLTDVTLDAIRSKGLVGFEAYLTSREIRNRWEESRLRWQALADAAMRLL